jgi:hypothetical protein
MVTARLPANPEPAQRSAAMTAATLPGLVGFRLAGGKNARRQALLAENVRRVFIDYVA